MLPDLIHDEFSSISPDSKYANDWNGGWNTLLCHCFPPTDSERFLVVPHIQKPVNLGFFIFTIERDDKPVMLVEIRPSASFSNPSSRAFADAQMRQHLADFYESSSSPTQFTALSTFGARVCEYTIDKRTNTIEPESIIGDPNRFTDVAPLERWNIDLTTQEGLDQIVEVFTEVKNMNV